MLKYVFYVKIKIVFLTQNTKTITYKQATYYFEVLRNNLLSLLDGISVSITILV